MPVTYHYEWWQTALRVVLGAMMAGGGAGLLLALTTWLHSNPGFRKRKPVPIAIVAAALLGIGVTLWLVLGNTLGPVARVRPY